MKSIQFEKDFVLSFNAAVDRRENKDPNGIIWNFVDSDVYADMKFFGWDMDVMGDRYLKLLNEYADRFQKSE